MEKRADACVQFGTRTEYSSIDEFVARKGRDAVDAFKLRPSKAQMVRDMRSIYGKDWPARRSGGVQVHSGGRTSAESAPGVSVLIHV
eukprot:IDg6231t1